MSTNLAKLEVWCNAVDLAVTVFDATGSFPRRAAGLADQMLRAAISVSSNIAEGKGRLTDRERRRFMGIARGSLLELQTQTIIARRVRVIVPEQAQRIEEMTGQVGRQLNGLIRYLSKA